MPRRSSRHDRPSQTQDEDMSRDTKTVAQSGVDFAKRPAVKQESVTNGKHKRLKRSDFETNFLLTNSKSCLISAKLSTLVCQSTWQLLSSDEQAACEALLPSVDLKTQPDGSTNLSAHFFEHNQLFLQDALREFQDNLAMGQLMPSQRKKVATASSDRRNGRADAYKEEHFER